MSEWEKQGDTDKKVAVLSSSFEACHVCQGKKGMMETLCKYTITWMVCVYVGASFRIHQSQAWIARVCTRAIELVVCPQIKCTVLKHHCFKKGFFLNPLIKCFFMNHYYKRKSESPPFLDTLVKLNARNIAFTSLLLFY